MKLSDYVLKFVADRGVKHVFLVTGGGAMHLDASLATETRITPICNSHEQASAMCAESYAKAVNGLGVALVTTGPGGTNTITGVAGAWLDSTPTLFISGQVKRPDRMFDAAHRQAARHAPARRAGGRHRLHRRAHHQVRRHRARPARHPLRARKGPLPRAQRPPRPRLDRHPARRPGRPDP